MSSFTSEGSTLGSVQLPYPRATCTWRVEPDIQAIEDAFRPNECPIFLLDHCQ